MRLPECSPSSLPRQKRPSNPRSVRRGRKEGKVEKYDPNKTLHDNLAAFGLSSRPGKISGKRAIFDPTTGNDFGEMDAFEATNFIVSRGD